MQSERWQEQRRGALQRAGYKCQLCSRTTGQLHVHHNDYSRLGNELPTDLVVLCERCHNVFHEQVWPSKTKPKHGWERRPDTTTIKLTTKQRRLDKKGENYLRLLREAGNEPPDGLTTKQLRQLWRRHIHAANRVPDGNPGLMHHAWLARQERSRRNIAAWRANNRA